MKRFLSLIIFCMSTCAVFAQTNTWTGTTNDHWETGTNWSLGVAPTPCHDIVIPAVSGKPSPKLYANISISNLTLSGGNLSMNNFNIAYTSAGPECGASVACGCTDCDLAAIKDPTNPSVSESATGTSTANYVIENTHLTSDGSSVSQSITYLDGLGRPMQKVGRQAGGFLLSDPNQMSDLVQPIEYDAYGREIKQYLAYATSGSTGNLVGSGVISAQASYFSGLGKSGAAYTDIVYENSPLNRIVSQKAPGSGTAQTLVYRGNTSGDGIKQLTYNFTTNNIDVSTYGAGKLFVTEITDENGNKTTEYKDMQDRVVCRDVATRKTYYCYDDFGLLRCVIPPKATGVLSASFNPTSNELLFAYTYDSRGRLTSKKIPSAGTTSMSYDTRDRLVTTTDAKAQAVTNVYDDLNRVTSVTLAGTEITHNYYDSYPTAVGGASENFDQANAYNIARLTSVKGMLAAVENRILGSTMLRTVTYYDNVGQVIQTTSQSHKTGWSRSSVKLDFAGRALETKLSTLNSLVVETRTSYDRGGRTKAICQKVTDATTGTVGAYWEPVGRYSYNGVGEMVSKTLGCNIQKVDYAYNMRGWMTSLNDPSQLVNEKDFFGMTLGYDGVGNISTWNYRAAQRTGTYGGAYAVTIKDPFAYSFTYDNLNRIKTANLVQTIASTPTTVFALGGSDGGKVNYDDNGNIINMKRTFKGADVDNLAYSIQANSNKLTGIVETGTNPNPAAGEFFGPTSNYTYDANGNLITDSGKGITNIVYNYLNLPQTITKSGQAISYDYAADGTKLKANFGAGKVYDYVAGLVYVNDSLEFIPTAEGRLLPPGRAINPQLNGSTAAPAGVKNTFYRYEYQINDHLGNLRVACRCGEKSGVTTPSDAYAPIIVQENHYDPWGLGLPLNADLEKVVGSPQDRFTYNGKEKQLGLTWFDYGARMYDPQIGRWGAVDPLAEQFPGWSPYNYGKSNPIRFKDVDGLAPFDITLLGANNSSVTVKTDLVDLTVNASGLGVDFGGNYTLSGNDVLQAALDIGGVFDPTPTLDIVGAGLSANSGDYWGAGASVLGAAVPYAGDLAKAGKIAKGVDKISNAIDAAKGGLKIDVSDAHKIERGLLDPPVKHGNAPTFKKDGTSVEVHHEGQKREGPFKEMHWKDHRGKGNDAANHPKKSQPSQVDRKEFDKAKREYWKEQYPKQ